MSKEKFTKKIYSHYRDFEHIINTSSGFLLIFAFIIVAPNLAEFQMAWLGAFITLAVATNLIIKKLEFIHPQIKLEEDFKRLIEEHNEKIKDLERRTNKK